ncbi:MAG: hypothetical protein H6Q89_2732 [Myxococcaceae bacterium]|nr:hypothetical protein [Myxococcaceae bacterium]
MRLLETIKSLNLLKKLTPSPASRAAAAFRDGQTLGEVMRDASDSIAREAVRQALAEFSDGPAALLITCLIESTTAGWELLASQLAASNQLPRDRSAWVAARLTDYGHCLSEDLMSQHLINLVLCVTGLHVEALVLTRDDVDARRLTEQLAELLKKGLSSGLPRAALAQTLTTPHRPTGRIIAPRPSAN